MNAPVSIIEQTDFVNLIVRVVVENEGKFLMVQEGKQYVYGLWSFPGGKVDVGEVLTEAATREIREETGVEIELVSVLGLHNTLWDNRPGLSLQVNFLAKVVQLPNVYPQSEEVLAVAWKSFEEIDELLREKKLRNRAQEVMIEMIKSGSSLPLSALFEAVTAGPKFPFA